MKTWALVMILTNGGMAVIQGFGSERQCTTAGALIRLKYEWLLPRVCVEVGGETKYQTPDECDKQEALENDDFEKSASEAARETDNKLCAKAKSEWERKAFCRAKKPAKDQGERR